MAKKPIMMSTDLGEKDGCDLTSFELKQLEQLKNGIKISPCRGSKNPNTKSYVMDVACSQFLTETERLTVCHSKKRDITMDLLRRHYQFCLKNFPNLLKEEVQESIENGVEIFRKRIVRKNF